MIELSTIFAGSFVLALSGALMPGPLLTVTIAEAARSGFKVGPLLMTGHSLLELLLVAGIVLGLGPFLKLPSVIGVIALLGGALLIYLGIDMIRTAVQLSLEKQTSEIHGGSSRSPILTGVLASLANPYWTLWWATIGLGYLVAAMKFGFTGIASFFLGHISADFAWYSLISFGVSRGKTFLGDRSYQLVIRICGALLFFFGGWFIFSARTFLAEVFL
jgi:threonine/homoserine/homoserine lactone efflux protein